MTLIESFQVEQDKQGITLPTEPEGSTERAEPKVLDVRKVASKIVNDEKYENEGRPFVRAYKDNLKEFLFLATVSHLNLQGDFIERDLIIESLENSAMYALALGESKENYLKNTRKQTKVIIKPEIDYKKKVENLVNTLKSENVLDPMEKALLKRHLGMCKELIRRYEGNTKGIDRYIEENLSNKS